MTSKAESASPLAFLRNNALFSTVADVWGSFHERRSRLGLSNPGTIENLAREVQRDVLLNNFMFSGIRADLTKVFGINPLFQVSHQFAMGDRINPYTFAALYGTSKVRVSDAVPAGRQLCWFPTPLTLGSRSFCKATSTTRASCPPALTTGGAPRSSPRRSSRSRRAPARTWHPSSTSTREATSPPA